MNYLMILLAVLIFTVQTLSFKKFNTDFMKNPASYFSFNFLSCMLIVIIFALPGGFSKGISPLTLMLGVSFGILYVITVLSYTKAMETGPLSYSTLFFSFGLLIPILCGALFWNEKISAVQFVGLILLLITFYLGSVSSEEKGKKVSFRWLVFCILTFLSNGSLGALSKEHQLLLPGMEVREFLVTAFGTSALLSLLLLGWYGLVKKQEIRHMKKASLIFVIMGAGGATAFGNQLILYLASRVPSVVMFPLVNGGIVLTSAVVSVLIYKERLTQKGIAGLITGMAALILLGIG